MSDPLPSEVPELGPLSLDRLTRDVWLWQRKKGHRFSADDVITAWVAVTQAPAAARVLDLGCGIGSVLLHLAWSLPRARLVGVEAQAISYALLLRNIAHNQLGQRVSACFGDLRDLNPGPATAPEALARLDRSVVGGDFDLITGTPPYFPVASALEAEDPQRAYARIEYRGGVEAYVQAAAPRLALGGRLVLCGDARAEQRALHAAGAEALSLIACTSVVARAPNAPLFAVWTFARADERTEPASRSTLTLRDAHGDRTAEAHALRDFSGIP